jgi:hypothetical protein
MCCSMIINGDSVMAWDKIMKLLRKTTVLLSQGSQSVAYVL